MNTHPQWLFVMINIIIRHSLKIVEKQQDCTYWPFSFFPFAFLSLKPCEPLNLDNLWLCWLLAPTLIHFLSRLPASSSSWSSRPCLCVCHSNLYILTAHEVIDYSSQIISLNFFLIPETGMSLPELVFPSLQDSHQDPGFLSAAAPPTENENGKEGLNPEVKFFFFFKSLFSEFLSCIHSAMSSLNNFPFEHMSIPRMFLPNCGFPSGNAVLFILCRLSVIPFIFLGSMGLCWSMPGLWVFSSNCRPIQENEIPSKLSFLCSHLYLTPIYTHEHTHPLGHFPECRTCYLTNIFH